MPAAIADYRPFAARTAGFTGSDIELAVTTAWRFALRDGATSLNDAHLTAALDDLIPGAKDQSTIDRMTLLALDETRNKRLLPRNHEAIRAEIAARRSAP
jgi:ATP-dependent Zn protease